MIIGGLSEKEVNVIEKLLKAENIEFTIIKDDSIINSNKESMKYDLRHLDSPSISTHVLAIELKEDGFEKMSESLKKELLKLGITNQIPDELELNNSEVEPIQSELNKGNKRLVGHNFLHQILLMLGAGAIYLLIKYFL
jgi:hypothetical protein